MEKRINKGVIGVGVDIVIQHFVDCLFRYSDKKIIEFLDCFSAAFIQKYIDEKDDKILRNVVKKMSQDSMDFISIVSKEVEIQEDW